ncbi:MULTISPECIES: amino acid ABC transporter permease [Rhizobium]|uniref:Glutamate/aspartate import permease protein GltK n=1 Tax=Rhizobium paranaense TaxID=1650438 RepID=A0A7W8XS75_9HYPH|nr:amino acid ABC transporter permease [Rhizobium paranaense]MBB5574634.1 polar amino acid transport system permease protein [Rhizobium paranaense]
MLTTSSGEYNQLTIVKPVKYANHIGAAIIVIALAFIANAFWKGDIAWSYVSDNLLEHKVLSGVANTIVMTICAMLLGISLGVVAALMRMSDNVVLRTVAVGYIWLFRGTPALLQLLLWFNLALIFPTISLFGLFPIRTVDVMTPFVAALLGLGIQQGAYTAEVVRAGVLSIDKGQTEAAQSVGMTKLRAMFSIVLPQAMRVIVPPIGNETIGMVKLTSLASVIQFAEVLRSVEDVYYVNSRVIELLIVAAIWYMIIVTVLSIGQLYIERHFSRGWGRRVHAEAVADAAPIAEEQQ